MGRVPAKVVSVVPVVALFVMVMLSGTSASVMAEVAHVPPVTFMNPVHAEEFCPVPPYILDMAVPFHVPVPMVPIVFKDVRDVAPDVATYEPTLSICPAVPDAETVSKLVVPQIVWAPALLFNVET